MAEDTKTDDTKTEDAPKSNNEVAAEEKKGMEHFAGTVEKVDADGNRSLSGYIDHDAGERLAADADKEAADAAAEDQAKADAKADGGTAPAPKAAKPAAKADDSNKTGNTVSTNDLLS